MSETNDSSLPASPFPLPGMITREEACRMFGVTPRQWKHWVSDGKVTCGVIVYNRVGGRCSVYPVEELKKLRESLFGQDKLYKNAAGTYPVPAGWGRRLEVCQMLGVDKATWEGWRGEGLLPPGQRFDGGPTLYRVEDLKKQFERIGLLAPPYSDPDRPGAYRVPLWGGGGGGGGGCGGDGARREAIVDAEWLPAVEGAVLTWGSGRRGEGAFVNRSRPDKPGGVGFRRVVMGVTDPTLQVGHVNGNPLDCRRANLFVRTIAERTRGACKMRALKGRPCTSRFKGVFFESWTKKWRANIVVDGKKRSLGRYGDEIAAAQAYDEAARRCFGEYAWLNFPDGVDARLEREAGERQAGVDSGTARAA